MKSGKKFFFWLGVMDAQYNKGQNKAARRGSYSGQTKLVWEGWQKVAYLTGYWQTVKWKKPLDYEITHRTLIEGNKLSNVEWITGA